MSARWIAICLLCALWASPAAARIERFAVVIGHNRGAPDEAELQYAETDAARVHDVLLQIGDVSPLNAVLLRGRDAGFVRSAVLSINERIRQLSAAADTQVVLIVYFSGHADAQALHLGGSELPLQELRQLATGSAADFRLVIVDACRSGALTRVKGGRRLPPFALPAAAEPVLPSDGIAFLTASASAEDAQESDELQSSFFTHALVTGLLGAADADRDGNVVLDEAYRYAYGATLRATSRTWAGTQHPTFQYDLRGRGELTLTRPAAHAVERATISFPPGLGFVLLRDSSAGRVALELEPSAQTRSLSLEPGRYFVRARSAELMYEGMLDAKSGVARGIELERMERIDYVRLVRKGGRASQLAHGPLIGASLRTALPNAERACLGPTLGYSVDVSHFGARAKLGTCWSALDNAVVQTRVAAYDVELQLYHAWELGRVSLEVGLGLGVSLFQQRFETRGSAPARLSAVPFIAPGLGAQVNVSSGYYLDLHLGAETHFLRLQDRNARSGLDAAFAVRTSVGVGKYF